MLGYFSGNAMIIFVKNLKNVPYRQSKNKKVLLLHPQKRRDSSGG
jgi:hypothetical protein